MHKEFGSGYIFIVKGVQGWFDGDEINCIGFIFIGSFILGFLPPARSILSGISGHYVFELKVEFRFQTSNVESCQIAP